MSFLAYGHPFLDGNGRTIMAVHVELAHRAGIRIDWSQTNKVEYLTALTKELNDPGKAHLDNYLAPFVSRADSSQSLANQLISIQGLDGRKQSAEQNEVLGSVDSPVLKARYEQQEEQRRQAYTQESIQPETTG